MTFEIWMAASMVAMAALALVHSLATRSRADALVLLATGVGFGYVFPLIDINVFEHYTFHGRLTVLSIPFYLGLAWYALYYLALSLAELALGREAGRLRLALLAAAIFGLLEAQWDPTLLEVGAMEMFLPSFATWRWQFHCGVPMFHAYLGFVWVYGFFVLRETGRPLAAALVVLAVILGITLSMMAMVPLMEPIFDWGRARFGQPVLVTFDALHFSSTFATAGVFAAWVLRRAGRWLGPGRGEAAS